MSESFEFDFKGLDDIIIDPDPVDPIGGIEIDPIDEPVPSAPSPVSMPSEVPTERVPGQGGLETYADIIFCIDLTGSMGPVINQVKNTALAFHRQMLDALDKRGRDVKQLRIKVIGYRDIYVDTEAFVESEFFCLPQEEDRFRSFVMNLRPLGGGDEPESGLEALVKAIKSDWIQEGARRRHVIAVFTDASAHKLEKNIAGTIPGMPKSLEEVEELWCSSSQDVELKLGQNDKRLVLFAPNRYPWTDISEEWDSVWHKVCNGGAGLEDIEMDTIINFLAKSF